jgi:hypothetical protein
MFHNLCYIVKFFDQFKIDKSLSINLLSMMKVVIKRFKVSSNGNDEIRKFLSQSLTVTSRVEMINTLVSLTLWVWMRVAFI